MIISRTPLRISFAGGSTDLASFYREYGGGAVTCAAIDRYVHVLVNDKFDRSVRVAYSKTENVDHVGDLQHGLFREAMKLTGVTESLEVHSVADIPGEGTGLGSSSTLTVGLLNALYAHRGVLKGPSQLAEEACRIEIEILGGTLGKQDQYIAAFGGLQYFEFRSDDTVRSTPIPLSRAARAKLEEHMSLFYTGITRQAQGILKAQTERTEQNRDGLIRMREMASETRDALVRHDWAGLGTLLDEGWRIKRSLSRGISTPEIDAAYERAKAAGAFGGKISGAGGGGFLLVVHPPERSAEIASALSPWFRMPVRINAEGSRILFVGE
ncbi:MAG: GHMP kinase [Thermoplasmata archaeon]|nr:GHMP kinase [Thermoplasmata archaeon]